MKLFKKSAIGVFFLFLATMVYVTFVSYSRLSGSTGLDMGKVQYLRYQAQHEKIAAEEESKK
jgi:hypothetical protein